MIHVRVELWPGGDYAHPRVLHTLNIANDGTGTKEIGNYNIWLNDLPRHDVDGRLEDYAREDGALVLVWRAIEELLG